MRQLSRPFSSGKTEILYPLNNNSPVLPPHSLWQSPSYFLFLWIWLLCILHKNGIIQYLSFCDWLISLSIMSSDSYMVQYVTGFPSVLRLSNIPLYVLHFFIHSLIYIWVASTFWLLWIILQWTWVCNYFFEILLSILLDIYPEVELLDHMVILFFIFWETSILFSIAAAPFYISTNSAQGFQFLHMITTLIFCFSDSDI